MMFHLAENRRALLRGFVLLAAFFFATAQSRALTYQLAGGNASWPADKRAAIVSAMDAAVALYNANGYFPKHLTANYNAGVPTAQAGYNGWIDFGGSIGTRVALHEIGHTLGVGTYWNWDPKRNTSTNLWTAPRALARLAFFDGAGAVLHADGVHFWPYGLNYDYEDSTTNRVRHIKMVAAMRWDMGIVTDSDSDGMPDDWEQFYFGGLGQTAAEDFDGDGVSNLSEYDADTNPAPSLALAWNGGTGAWNTTTPNWTGAATLWRNGASDTATFGGTAGTVTPAAGTLVNDMIFNTTGYVIAGAALELTGPAPTVTTASNVAATVQPVLTGDAGLVKNGAGTLTLSGASTFSGPLTINAGTLAIAPGGRLFMNGGSCTLEINSGATLSFSGNWGWDGTLRYLGVQEEGNVIDGGTLQHTGASNPKTSGGAGRLFTIGTAGATLDSATAGAEFSIGYRTDFGSALVSLGGTLTLTGAGDGDLNYNLPGTGALVKRGAGLWKLTGTANSFSGGTTIGVSNDAGTVGGILQINDSTSLGTGAVTVLAGDLTSTSQGAQLQLTGGVTLANPTVTISGLGFGAANGVILNVSGNNTITGAVRLTSGAGGSVIGSDAGKLTLSGGMTTIAGSRTIEFTGAGNIDVTGAITNGSTAALPLTKSGAGTLIFTGANTYTGATTVSEGTLQVGANTSTGTLGTGAVTNDATLRFHRSDTALVVPNVISGSGALVFGVSTGGELSAETTLSGANTSTGNVTVSSGGVRITRSDALGTGAKTVTMTNGTNGNCRLILDGSGGNIALPANVSFITSNSNTTNPTIVNEAGNNTIAGNFSLMSGGGSTRVRVDAGTLALTGQFTPAVSGRTLQLDGAESGTFSGALKNNGGNTVALEKFGEGTWTLTGTGHTYTGTTTINAGKLAFTGTLASTITASAGSVAPQGSASTSGGVDISAGGHLEVRIKGPTVGTQYDRLTVGGGVTLAGALDIIAALRLTAGTTFTILNKSSAGAISGTFTGKPQGSVFASGGYNWLISYTGGDGNDVTLTLATPLQSWRYQSFGTVQNTGTAADTFDANGDGEANLLEFASGQNPNAATRATPALVKKGATLEFTYTRANAALAAGVTFTVEWRDTLAAGSWSNAGVSEQILSTNGIVQTVRASVAAGSGSRFLHLKISEP